MDYKAMGKRIRQARREQGITQNALAKQANISASFLGHIERGSRKASLETFVSIANTLKIGTDTLLMDSLDLAAFGGSSDNISIERKKLMSDMMRVLDENKEAWA